MILHASALSPLCRYVGVGCDVMIVDPPYAPKVHAKAVSAGTGGAGVRQRDLGFGHLTPDLTQRIAEYAAQVRRWSAVFCDRESTHLWRAAMAQQGVEYIRTIPWVRWSQPQMSGDRPPTGAEDIVLFHRAAARKRSGEIIPMRKRWNGPGNRVAYDAAELDSTCDPPRCSGCGASPAFADECDCTDPVAREVYDARSLRGRDKYSCEKPLDLMLALVSDYSDPGEIVLDPCAGVGTTGLAAELLGREFVGIERSPEAHARADLRLFAARCPHDQQVVTEDGALPGGLSTRDEERACRWVVETRDEAAKTPHPKAVNGSDVRTFERAQRRLADARKVAEYGSK